MYISTNADTYIFCLYILYYSKYESLWYDKQTCDAVYVFWLVGLSMAFCLEWPKMLMHLLWWPNEETRQSNIILIYIYTYIYHTTSNLFIQENINSGRLFGFAWPHDQRRCIWKSAITHVNLLWWPNEETCPSDIYMIYVMVSILYILGLETDFLAVFGAVDEPLSCCMVVQINVFKVGV